MLLRPETEVAQPRSRTIFKDDAAPTELETISNHDLQRCRANGAKNDDLS
jgi:hypothetical protein